MLGESACLEVPLLSRPLYLMPLTLNLKGHIETLALGVKATGSGSVEFFLVCI